MTDSTLNRFVSSGTNAQRLAFTPSVPTPASGPNQLYVWFETDTGNTYGYATGAWTQINTGGGGGGTTTIVQPQGRLTLVTGVPVMISDQTAKTTIYWTAYVGNACPIYSGSAWSMISTNTDITYILNTTSHLSTNLYDLFLYSNSGTLTLGSSPAWTNSTTRSNAIALKNGIWTNNATITLVLSNTTSTTSIGANQATYVGTIYATANGQTGMAFRPTGASGGTNAILGLYNSYNRVPTGSRSSDSTNSWSYNSATWRASNASNSNRISWIDGLGQSFIECTFSTLLSNSGTVGEFGINLDSTSATPTMIAACGTPSGGGPAKEIFFPTLGFHFAQAMESTGGTSTYYGFNGTSSGWMQLNAKLDM